MEYTEKLGLPIIEDDDNFALCFTQINESNNIIESKLGDYENLAETVVTHNTEIDGLTNDVADINQDIATLQQSTTNRFPVKYLFSSNSGSNYPSYTDNNDAIQLVCVEWLGMQLEFQPETGYVDKCFSKSVNITPLLNALGINMSKIKIVSSNWTPDALVQTNENVVIPYDYSTTSTTPNVYNYPSSSVQVALQTSTSMMKVASYAGKSNQNGSQGPTIGSKLTGKLAVIFAVTRS